MVVDDWFGFKANDLEICRKAVEGACGCQMELHDSSYVAGGDYYRARFSKEEQYQLQHNYDEREGYWEKDEYKDMPILLYVSTRDKARADEIRARLLRTVEGIHFLYRGISSLNEDGHTRTLKTVEGKEVVVEDRIIKEENGRRSIIKVVEGKEVVVYDKEIRKRQST